MSVAARIKELNITLPAFQDAVGTYRKCIRDGNLMHTSTHFGMDSEGKTIPGKVGTPEQAAHYKGTQQVHSPEAAKQMARNAGLRLLSTLSHHLDGNLDRVEQVVKLVGIVNGLEDFTGHGAVINGCSDVLCEVLGDEVGKGARTCTGSGSLGAAVTCDLVVRVRDEK